jgi:hypothetical protein
LGVQSQNKVRIGVVPRRRARVARSPAQNGAPFALFPAPRARWAFVKPIIGTDVFMPVAVRVGRSPA